MANANKISVDAAVAAVLSELGGILTLKEEPKNVFSLSPDRLWQKLAKVGPLTNTMGPSVISKTTLTSCMKGCNIPPTPSPVVLTNGLQFLEHLRPSSDEGFVSFHLKAFKLRPETQISGVGQVPCE